MRLVLAVIASACALSILIDSPRRELSAQLQADWQEHREHVGDPAFPATSENLSDFLKSRLDTDR